MANESDNTLPSREWCEPTPDASDEGSSDSDGSIEYDSEEPLTPWPQKKPHGEEGDNPDYDPRVDVELQGPCVEPQEDPILGPNGDVEQQQLEVQ